MTWQGRGVEVGSEEPHLQLIWCTSWNQRFPQTLVSPANSTAHQGLGYYVVMWYHPRRLQSASF